VGGVGRCLLQCLDDHSLHGVVANLTGSTGAGFVVQSLESKLEESSTPLPDRATRDPDPSGDLVVVAAVGTCEDDPAPQSKCLGTRRAPCPTFERLPLVVTQHHRLQS
jgi:hypothetical protein